MLLPATFYSVEAERKGVTSSQVLSYNLWKNLKSLVIYFQYGLVYGVDSLFGFIFSLVFGHFGSRIGLKVLYSMGTLVSGTCGILFGCLSYIQNKRLFLGLSYLLWYNGHKCWLVLIS